MQLTKLLLKKVTTTTTTISFNSFSKNGNLSFV